MQAGFKVNGLLVVSNARYCGISELLTEGQNALLLDKPMDGGILADLLKQIYSDADLRIKLSEGALAFAAQHLWSQQALRQDAIYRSVNKLQS